MTESSKLEGPSNYVVWKINVKTILLKEGLWDLVDPKGEIDVGVGPSKVVNPEHQEESDSKGSTQSVAVARAARATTFAIAPNRRESTSVVHSCHNRQR
jgi:hypothetical protein